jgi:hypothetical protein
LKTILREVEPLEETDAEGGGRGLDILLSFVECVSKVRFALLV